MNKIQQLFGMTVGLSVLFLGVTVISISAIGWGLMAVGATIGMVSFLLPLMERRPALNKAQCAKPIAITYGNQTSL